MTESTPTAPKAKRMPHPMEHLGRELVGEYAWLQDKTDANRLLLVTNMGAGHAGASGRYDRLREDAQVYAFLLDTVAGGTEALPASG